MNVYKVILKNGNKYEIQAGYLPSPQLDGITREITLGIGSNLFKWSDVEAVLFVEEVKEDKPS